MVRANMVDADKEYEYMFSEGVDEFIVNVTFTLPDSDEQEWIPNDTPPLPIQPEPPPIQPEPPPNHSELVSELVQEVTCHIVECNDDPTY